MYPLVITNRNAARTAKLDPQRDSEISADAIVSIIGSGQCPDHAAHVLVLIRSLPL